MIEDRYFSARSSILFAIYFHALFLSFSLSRSVSLCLCVAVLLVCFFRLPVSSLSLSRSAVITSFYLLSSPPLVSVLQLSSFSLTILPLFLFVFCQLSLIVRTALLFSLSILLSSLLCFLLFFCHLFLSNFFADTPIVFFLLFSYVTILQSFSFFLLLFFLFLSSQNFFLSFSIFYNYFSDNFSCPSLFSIVFFFWEL